MLLIMLILFPTDILHLFLNSQLWCVFRFSVYRMCHCRRGQWNSLLSWLDALCVFSCFLARAEVPVQYWTGGEKVGVRLDSAWSCPPLSAILASGPGGLILTYRGVSIFIRKESNRERSIYWTDSVASCPPFCYCADRCIDCVFWSTLAAPGWAPPGLAGVLPFSCAVELGLLRMDL